MTISRKTYSATVSRNRYRLPLGLLAVLLAGATAVGQTPIQAPAVNLALPGTAFNPGVRGQALPSINQFRTNGIIGNQMGLAISRGSSIRGVAGGLEADIYNWRNRNNDARSTTLEYMRWARDYDAELVITTNVRGLIEPDPAAAEGWRRYYDTSIPTLSKMAADWVRYTNVIAQTYRIGDVITNPADQTLINSLIWSTAANDMHDKLPTRTEAPLPKVKYWEIGNEPTIGLSNAYKISNGFTFLTPNHTVTSAYKYDYRERYAAMTSAMKAVDPTIKVGPTLVSASSTNERELLDSILNRQSNGQYLPLDFISYHPYQSIQSTTNTATLESNLRGIYNAQNTHVTRLRGLVAASGRAGSSVELIASEVNVSNWNTNDTAKEANMAHALGSVETVFSLARLGVRDAHYWLWPGDPWDWTEYPSYKAYEGLRDHMGDTLLSTYFNNNARLYTTRDSDSGKIAVWGLNFSNTTSVQLKLALSNLPLDGYDAKLMTLKAPSGPTTLYSSNLASYMPGGPTAEVDWTTVTLVADISNYVMTLPAATISTLVLTPRPRPGDFNENGDVDAPDLGNFKLNFGKKGNATHLHGDADGDCDVDGADFLIWQRQLGTSTAPAAAPLAAAVPEPHSWRLVAAAALLAYWRKTRSGAAPQANH